MELQKLLKQREEKTQVLDGVLNEIKILDRQISELPALNPMTNKVVSQRRVKKKKRIAEDTLKTLMDVIEAAILEGKDVNNETAKCLSLMEFATEHGFLTRKQYQLIYRLKESVNKA